MALLQYTSKSVGYLQRFYHIFPSQMLKCFSMDKLCGMHSSTSLNVEIYNNQYFNQNNSLNQIKKPDIGRI